MPQRHGILEIHPEIIGGRCETAKMHLDRLPHPEGGIVRHRIRFEFRPQHFKTDSIFPGRDTRHSEI